MCWGDDHNHWIRCSNLDGSEMFAVNDCPSVEGIFFRHVPLASPPRRPYYLKEGSASNEPLSLAKRCSVLLA